MDHYVSGRPTESVQGKCLPGVSCFVMATRKAQPMSWPSIPSALLLWRLGYTLPSPVFYEHHPLLQSLALLQLLHRVPIRQKSQRFVALRKAVLSATSHSVLYRGIWMLESTWGSPSESQPSTTSGGNGLRRADKYPEATSKVGPPCPLLRPIQSLVHVCPVSVDGAWRDPSQL